MILYNYIETLVKQGQMWETFMWHYRPWSPIVDGRFLPAAHKRKGTPPLAALLPDHPDILRKTGNFTKVFFNYYISEL